MGTVQVIAAALALAFLAESLTEYIFGTLFDKIPALEPYKWALMYVALAVGVGVALYYQLDLLSLVLEQTPTTVGEVLSGLVIGRGANYLHDFVSSYITKG